MVARFGQDGKSGTRIVDLGALVSYTAFLVILFRSGGHTDLSAARIAARFHRLWRHTRHSTWSQPGSRPTS